MSEGTTHEHKGWGQIHAAAALVIAIHLLLVGGGIALYHWNTHRYKTLYEEMDWTIPAITQLAIQASQWAPGVGLVFLLFLDIPIAYMAARTGRWKGAITWAVLGTLIGCGVLGILNLLLTMPTIARR